jgi:hypothetical protein
MGHPAESVPEGELMFAPPQITRNEAIGNEGMNVPR